MMHNFRLAVSKLQASVKEDISNLADLCMHKQEQHMGRLMCSSAGEWHT